MRYNVGYSLSGFIILVLIPQLIYMTLKLIRTTYRSSKAACIKRKNSKKQKIGPI
jgi:inner membrane protein involved in colicin E2 resistance